MLPFHTLVQDDFKQLDETILSEMASDVSLVEDIGQYLISAGGKRLRPLTLFLMARALGYNGQQHIWYGAVIEFIHTATLLHDDVVDMSKVRRGKPTANAHWGNAPSVLVGDFLYSRSFQMMVNAGDLKILKLMSDTTNVISEGEVQQLVNAANPDVSEDDYFEVIRKKTAVLFSAACGVAAHLASSSKGAGGTRDKIELAASRYGEHLGIAFQLMDDVLDYQGDADAMGKNVGDDLSEGKATLPLIYAMKQCDTDSRSRAQRILSAAKSDDTPPSSDDTAFVIDLIKTYKGCEYTQERAQKHIDEALKYCAELLENEYSSQLRALADFAISRQH